MAEEQDNRYAAPAEVAASASATEEALRELTLLEQLVAHFGDKIQSTSQRLGEDTALVAPSALLEVMQWLRDEAGFVLLSDLTAHDCHGTEPRFWVVYQLTNVQRPALLRVKVGVTEKKPHVESVVALWPGADFLEREVYDLMGIEFKNHPDLRRIMMPDEWEGHPLRKDYPTVYEPVAFSHNQGEVNRAKPFARE